MFFFFFICFNVKHCVWLWVTIYQRSTARAVRLSLNWNAWKQMRFNPAYGYTSLQVLHRNTMTCGKCGSKLSARSIDHYKSDERREIFILLDFISLLAQTFFTLTKIQLQKCFFFHHAHYLSNDHFVLHPFDWSWYLIQCKVMNRGLCMKRHIANIRKTLKFN